MLPPRLPLDAAYFIMPIHALLPRARLSPLSLLMRR